METLCIVYQVCMSLLGSMVEMKDVHFLRLLAVVLESGIDDIPAVLKSYSHYCKLIHPI